MAKFCFGINIERFRVENYLFQYIQNVNFMQIVRCRAFFIANRIVEIFCYQITVNSIVMLNGIVYIKLPPVISTIHV